MMRLSAGELKRFVSESNRIEGIDHVNDDDVKAHERLFALEAVTVGDLCAFVTAVAPRAGLRNRVGMNVVVGDHRPPPGGPRIESQLEKHLASVRRTSEKPDGVGATRVDVYHDHCFYETLHPFTDGNGRSGRALALWQLRGNLHGLGWLHWWYYASLSSWKGRNP